ncbi:MAG: PilN domain-containing protein [Patescibacteria group bacterium]|nr:PilN domain-containing protein [Patescibacteria group bacterium]
MISLLPPIEKEKRVQEKILKLIWILGILIIASTLSFGLILLSIKFYIADEIVFQEASIEVEREKNFQVQVLQKKINSVNNSLSELNDFYENQFSLSAFVEEFSLLVESSVYLENFSYQTRGSQVVFTGYALDIDSANNFRQTLREQEDFKETNFVIPDWLQQKGVNFRVSFNLEK